MAELSLFEEISLLPEAEQAAILETLTDEDMASAQLWLRPRQMEALEADAWITLVLAGRGFGKRLDVDTPIPTPVGWTTMGELCPGDEVFDERGEVCRVIKAHDVVYADAIELEMTGGVKIVADPDHQWQTITARERKKLHKEKSSRTPVDWPFCVPIRTTQEIVETLTYGPRGDVNHFIPTADPLQLPRVDLPVDPWLLGFWLAEGSDTVLCTSQRDLDHVLAQVKKSGAKIGAVRLDPRSDGAAVNVLGLRAELRKIGIDAALTRSGTKFIPSMYLRAAEDQRLALLQGLMDGDGCLPSQKSRTGARINRFVYGTTSIELHRGICELLTSLGARWFEREKEAKIGDKSYGPLYEVAFHPSKGAAQPARLERRQLPPTQAAQQDRHLARSVIGWKAVGKRAMRCIEVDSPSSLFLCSRWMVPTHNSRTGAHWVIEKAKVPGTRIALLGRTVADVRDVMVAGESGILRLSAESFMPEYQPTVRRLVWPNGSVALTYSSESPDQLRGPQQHYAWVDELAACKQKPDSSGLTAWDNLQISTRLGESPQILATTTPKRTQVIRDLVRQAAADPTRVKKITGSTLDNRSNLSTEYIQSIYDRYAGTALEAQELYGEFVDVVEGALWRPDDFHFAELPSGHEIDMMAIVAVDPAVTSGGDEVGIVVIKTTLERKLDERKVWVVDDFSVQGAPEVWAKAVHQAYRKWQSSFHPTVVVAEKNQGGELISSVLRQDAPDLPVALISASKSKAARAEPVVYAYRKNRVFHTEDFPELTQEMLDWEEDARWSPNRLDACVHGIRAAIIDPKPLLRYSKLIVGELARDITLASAAPSYRGSRGSRISPAPWRSQTPGSSFR